MVSVRSKALIASIPGRSLRRLETVQSSSRIPFVNGMLTYLYIDFSQLPEVFIENEALKEEEHSTRLRLPCSEFMQYDTNDLQFLSDIENEQDITKVIQDYVLGTVSEALRLMENLPVDVPLAKGLQFRLSSELCTAHHARWDILCLVSARVFEIVMTMLIIHVARSPQTRSTRHQSQSSLCPRGCLVSKTFTALLHLKLYVNPCNSKWLEIIQHLITVQIWRFGYFGYET
jgi:hypothetical protein